MKCMLCGSDVTVEGLARAMFVNTCEQSRDKDDMLKHEKFLIDYVLARARVMPKGMGYGQLAGDAEREWRKIQEKVKGGGA